jgi:hypothetical protein
MSAPITEAPAAGIGKLLMDNRFLVPNHQRDYSWTEDEVRQLFDDLESAVEKSAGVYFLGLMVFLNTAKGNLVVLDGQQRLATAVVIFSAIRSWLSQYSEHQSDANKVQEWFIGRSELGEKNPEPRLTMNSANAKVFTDYVVKSVPSADIKAALEKLKKQDRNRKLLEATLYAHERIAKLASTKGGPAEAAKYLFRIVHFLRDNVSVVKLTVPSEEAAFTIFETLNDRGLDLSPLDLVKNHLFSKADAGKDPEELVRDMEERWAQMMSTLGNARPDNFLKAFWTSRHGRIRSTALFDAFKKEYGSTEQAIELSVDMQQAAEQYAGLDAPDDSIWSAYPPEARVTLRSLRVLGSQQAHPVLLAALNRFEPVEMERLLRLLEVVIVRYLLIGGGNTGRFETTCAILARKIFAKEVKTASEASHDFKDIYPSDDDFRQAFSIKQERSNQKAAYFLRRLELEAQRVAAAKLPGELTPGTSLTVEHILPKNPAKDWEPIVKADPELVQDCVFRLGNMTLLTNVNKELGRKSFDEKKKVFADSKLITTKSVADQSSWDRKAIEQRQQALAKLASAAWRFQ